MYSITYHKLKKKNPNLDEFLSTASYSARTKRYSMKHQDNQSVNMKK